MGPRFHSFFATLVGTSVAFTSGLSLGYSSAAAFQVFFSLGWSSVFASSLNVGGLVGSLLSGYLLSKCGRRWTMCFACLTSVIGWMSLRVSSKSVYEAYSPTILFIFGRILTGVSAGIAIPSSATYLLEIAPRESHALFCTLTQIGIVSGIMIAYIFGAWLRWEDAALVDALISLLLLALIPSIVESPKWLFKVGRTQQANAAHTRLSGAASVPLCNESMYPVEEGLEHDAPLKLRARDFILPCGAIPQAQKSRLRVAMLLMVFQQMSGINAILYYAESVCMIGGSSWATRCAILLGVAQLVFTVGAAFVINRFSRKRMLQWSSLVMAVAHSLHGALLLYDSTHPLANSLGKIFILLFLLGFSFGWGPLPILVCMDLFPTSVRGFGAAAAIAVNWITSFVVTFAFEPLGLLLGMSTLYFAFALFCVFGYLFTGRYVPDSSKADLL